MKTRTKLLILLAVVVLALGGWGFDILRARGYAVEVVSMSPDPGVADGQTPVTIRLRVTRGADPCAGHILYAVSRNGGSFKAKRVATDAEGVAQFTYYPYLKSKLNALTDVSLHFADESNSVFVSVPARTDLTLRMVESEDGGSDKKTNEDMFG